MQKTSDHLENGQTHQLNFIKIIKKKIKNFLKKLIKVLLFMSNQISNFNLRIHYFFRILFLLGGKFIIVYFYYLSLNHLSPNFYDE